MTETTATQFRTLLISLYNGASARSRLFRYCLLAFDIFSILFFVVATVATESPWIRALELIVAVVISADFLARFWIAPNKRNYLMQFTTWTDIIIIITLLVPFVAQNFVFLRVLRAFRLVRTYHVVRDLRKEWPFFKRNEEVINSVVDLSVFLFVITGVVYVMQANTNENINNYIDALYFTVTALTTTGFGDITLEGTSGRLLAVIIMVVGVALFVRLVQTIFRPEKIKYKCPDCGLSRHEMDAVHCKHCGRTISIESDGVL